MILFSSINSYAECNKIGIEEVDENETVFGGCKLVIPTVRAGYSSEYRGYLGLGVVVPINESSDWEGGFGHDGMIITASKYLGDEIYDVGYAKTYGWIFFRAGWETGLSFKNSSSNMYGIYLGGTFFGDARIRYLEGRNDSEFSFEIGFKY